MSNEKFIRATLKENNGIFRMLPNFTPRQFSSPGRRLRLHPDDYYALGVARGAIKERWFSSIIRCKNGSLASEDEGLSYVLGKDGKFTLKEAVEILGPELLGDELYKKYGTWPMYSKFFDYDKPLFHHLHLDFDAASRVGALGKPEAYFYPEQYNNYPGSFPHTFFGFDPGVTKQEVRERLEHYEDRDNRITELSRAYRIRLGTGWYTPPGVIHAPGSYLTYEPQWNSDLNSVFENIASGEVYGREFLEENCPEDKKGDIDYLISLLDWEKNTDPDYMKHYFRPPVEYIKTEDFKEEWITYGNDYIAAKRLTVYPGRKATVKDTTPYGCIVIQGFGKFGDYIAHEAGMLRFGSPSQDEYFVAFSAANQGITIENLSQTEPLVILKHFPKTSETP